MMIQIYLFFQNNKRLTCIYIVNIFVYFFRVVTEDIEAMETKNFRFFFYRLKGKLNTLNNPNDDVDDDDEHRDTRTRIYFLFFYFFFLKNYIAKSYVRS